MTTALIDMDVVLWRSACSAEKDEAWVAQSRADKMMQDILEETGATSYRAFISGPRDTNFRININPLYKANRADLPQPTHKAAVREFLVTHWKAEITDGYEADDALGIAQGADTMICGVDKDLLQIPGKHYNFVKKLYQEVTPDQGLKALYMQSLIGDRSDNIIGVAGIGPVKAEKALGHLLPEEYYGACRSLYNDDERYHMNMGLLYIWRKPNDIWIPPL
jgi:DNA polymerase-1